MYCHEYEDPDKKDIPHDVAIHNMIEADKYLDITVFCCAVLGYLNAHPDKNYQDVEIECANLRLNTCLYAREYDTKIELEHPDKKTKCLYEVNYSCAKYEDACKIVSKHWPIYDDNFKALKLSG